MINKCCARVFVLFLLALLVLTVAVLLGAGIFVVVAQPLPPPEPLLLFLPLIGNSEDLPHHDTWTIGCALVCDNLGCWTECGP